MREREGVLDDIRKTGNVAMRSCSDCIPLLRVEELKLSPDSNVTKWVS